MNLGIVQKKKEKSIGRTTDNIAKSYPKINPYTKISFPAFSEFFMSEFSLICFHAIYRR